ncbi:MAG: D-lactate dehydrogenase [Pseudomonadota bacterium]
MLDASPTTDLVTALKSALSASQVLTSPSATERYRKGFRSGEGEAAAVVFPKTLVELWRVLEACVEANAIIIMQAANTGLTEGSTPKGSYDRPVVIVSTLGMDALHVLPGDEQVVALPGTTLFSLEKELKARGRLPHSVIGSSSIGATVIGGICNNSGGALVQRGVAYTELALYAQRMADGTLRLVNNLDIDLGTTPEEILTNVENGTWKKVHETTKKASDVDYAMRIRDVDADTPARYNADPRCLYEASGSAGKVCVFAVRLDTFAEPKTSQVFYIGSNDASEFTTLRRALLTEMTELPVLAEYMHRGMFNIAETHGKDTYLLIKWLGTDRLPMFFTLKGKMDAIWRRLPFTPSNLTDVMMQIFARLMPRHLPKFLRQFRDRYEHHLILKVEDDAIAEAETILARVLKPEQVRKCSAEEGAKAFLHRFAAAGAAVRYTAVSPSEVEDVIALDLALRRNDTDWFETLPKDITKDLVSALYYGHFMCHAFHQDYLVKQGRDPKAVKAKLMALLQSRGGEYPSEHNVGHLYEAPPALKAHYEGLDPTNTFNPGIGKTSRDAPG